MSTKNKKTIASQALLDMDAITSAIKEESRKSINLLLAEAVRDVLREGCEKEEEEKDYDVIDDETKDAEGKENSVAEPVSDDEPNSENGDEPSVEGNAEDSEAETEPEIGEPAGEEGTAEEAPETGDGSEAEWDNYSEYASGNDYDLTGEKDFDKVMKVYKLLGNDDTVVVNRDGDKINLKDSTNGADYIIDLGDEPKVDDGEDMGSSDSAPEINESDIAGIDDDGFDDKGVPSIEDLMQRINAMQNEIDTLKGEQQTEPSINESKTKRTRKSMKGAKDTLFEIDLGYTDSYQDKDPMAGLSNSEPSKNKSLDKGIPTDTKKPWAGDTKSKGQPFEKTIEETEEPLNEDFSVTLAADCSELDSSLFQSSAYAFSGTIYFTIDFSVVNDGSLAGGDVYIDFDKVTANTERALQTTESGERHRIRIDGVAAELPWTLGKGAGFDLNYEKYFVPLGEGTVRYDSTSVPFSMILPLTNNG